MPGDELTQEERELLEEIWAHASAEEQGYCPVQEKCTYISFVSISAGRKKEKGLKSKEKRKRRAREVELVRYGKKIYTIKDIPTNGIDIIESEIFDGFPIPDETSMHEEFLKRLRSSQKKNKKKSKKSN